MPRSGRKRAANLGSYAQKGKRLKIAAPDSPLPPLEPPSPCLSPLPSPPQHTPAYVSSFDEDANTDVDQNEDQMSLSAVELAVTQRISNRFNEFLAISQNAQRVVVRRGQIEGVKSSYQGRQINGKRAPRTQQLDAKIAREQTAMREKGILRSAFKRAEDIRARKTVTIDLTGDSDESSDAGEERMDVESLTDHETTQQASENPEPPYAPLAAPRTPSPLPLPVTPRLSIAVLNPSLHPDSPLQSPISPPIDPHAEHHSIPPSSPDPGCDDDGLELDNNDDIDLDGDDDEDPEEGKDLLTDGVDEQAHLRKHVAAPSPEEAALAADDLLDILRPSRGLAGGRYHAKDIDELTRSRLQMMMMQCNLFAAGKGWIAASVELAASIKRGGRYAEHLRAWARAFIADRAALPKNIYGRWKESALFTDEDFRTAIEEHLTSIGATVSPLDILQFVNTPEHRARLKLDKPITYKTAGRWIKMLGYRWGNKKKGQYTDGHESPAVVEYRQNVFVPKIMEVQERCRQFDKDGNEVARSGPEIRAGASEHLPSTLPPRTAHIEYHDESTFYAHDRRTTCWVAAKASPKPYPKGEGQSFMISDFVSADRGWLSSPDGSETARIELKAGKNRDGYLTCEDVLLQATRAMDILSKYYPAEEVYFVFDNATTHSKRADGALSARRMPKGTSSADKNWGVQVNATNPDGSLKYDEHGKLLKVWHAMQDGTFADGRPQPLYFPNDHPTHPGCFKGMAVILEERGYTQARTLKAQCNQKFQCPPGRTDCCCRRLLFTQPDFSSVPSQLELHCAARGFHVIFLPKFHPELNPIEMCWGYAKRVYREKPMSSKIEDLVDNVRDSLAQVSLLSMRKFANRSLRYTSAYAEGLTGKEALWAAKKYSGHRNIPSDAVALIREEVAKKDREREAALTR